MSNSREPAGRNEGQPQYGDNSCLRFARLFGFIRLRARFGGKLSVARKADVIGREDVGKRVGNVMVIKVGAAVREDGSTLTLTHFSCVLQDCGGISHLLLLLIW